MLGIIVESGANLFIIIVAILIGALTGLSVTDALKSKDKKTD